MNNPAEELDKRFNAFKELEELEDHDEYFSGVIKYFRFIESTYPLNHIAHSIFSSHTNLGIMANVKTAYEKIILGKSKPSSYIISPTGTPGISIFHSRMIEEAKKVGLTMNKTIILHTEEGSQRICLAGDTPLCYPLKGKSTQRFRIVFILFRIKTNKTIREVAGLLNKNEEDIVAQDILKREIRKINKNFKSCLKIDDDLIIIDKSGSKNIYFLNRECFNFKTEK